MVINQDQLGLDSVNNPTVGNWFDGYDVIPVRADSPLRAISVPMGAQAVAIDNSKVSGKISLGLGTTNEGVMAADGGATVDVPSTNVVRDADGILLNGVEVRDANGNALTEEGTDNEILGLLTSPAGALDGDSIGTPGFENLTLSFVVPDGAGFRSVALSSAEAVSLWFGLSKARRRSEFSRVRGQAMSGGNMTVINQSVGSQANYKTRVLTVTQIVPANTPIDINTGFAAPGSLLVAPTSDVISLGNSAAEFAEDDKLTVKVNGLESVKGGHVMWDDANTIRFPNLKLRTGNVLIFEQVEVVPV